MAGLQNRATSKNLKENWMKKVFSFVTTVFLMAGLMMGQTGGDKANLNPQPLPPGKKASNNTASAKTQTSTKGKTNQKGGKKGHKGSKKNSGGTSATPPPK